MENSNAPQVQALNEPNVVNNEEGTIEGEENQQPSKRSKRSIAWSHFTRKKINDEMKAVCNHCKKKLVGEVSDGTSHLLSHMKICPLLKGNILNTSEEDHAFDPDISREKLVRMIAMHEIPFRFVELEGVRDFLESLRPSFKMPSRNAARNHLMKMYEQEKLKVLESFGRNQSRVAITTDMWTNNQKKGFMAITAHYVDDSWKLQSRIIRFVNVMTPHTAENIRDVPLTSLMDWNLDSKLSTLTVDNCTTNDALIDGLLSKIPKKHLLCGGLLFHMRCCAHILNLIVKEGLKYCFSSIEKIRESVVYWTTGPKRVEKFEEVLGQLKILYTKKLAIDVNTRWNSTFLMLGSCLPYRDAFERLSLLDS